MTMPEPRDRDVQPLGARTAPPGDPTSQGGAGAPEDTDTGVAGPSYPPEETEPDA